VYTNIPFYGAVDDHPGDADLSLPNFSTSFQVDSLFQSFVVATIVVDRGLQIPAKANIFFE
jgi:hypothetical protein